MIDGREQPASLPTAGGVEFLVVGKVRRPHGVRGDVVVEIYNDSPEGLAPNRSIFIGENHVRMIIARRRKHNEGLLLGFEGVSSPEQAGRYRNQILSIAVSEMPVLSKGRYYFHDLIDLRVIDESGKDLGTLSEILETGANDVYVVKTSNGKDLLLPAISDVVMKVDLVAKYMQVRLLSGLKNK
jgi:16S rRNA processing protein RimM